MNTSSHARQKFFEVPWPEPATIAVSGVKPFEMYGYPRTLIWLGSGYAGTPPKMYGTGVNEIGFQPPEMESRSKEWLELSPVGKHAKTMISRYSGGLNGEGEAVGLIKVGDDWFVTDMRLVYES